MDTKLKNRLIDFSQLKFEVHNEMRYDDVGDYFGNTIIAYDMKDEIVNNAIMLHEFIEYTLIKSAGIPVSMIDDFDDNPDTRDLHPREHALYRKFHRLANAIEQQFIENLGLNWKKHEENIDTAQVAVAMKKLEKELHKEKPSQEKMEQSAKTVEETFKEEK
ncbi:MAG TPA: hypothetical protein VMR41_00830 [Patescibacteria group bacterium]|nr:hypothetical protein [Patescibacteria group bacterium]